MTPGTEAAGGSEVEIEMRGACALVTLNRPRALNALTPAMIRRMAENFPRFARNPQVYAAVIQSASPRAFCSGADVRETTRLGREDPAAARRMFREEYSLNWLLECFMKPTVSLIGGLCMGGGVGISLYGTHRVAGEGYSFAMPETGIGLFPDVGVAHVLARLPHNTGLYLGLTGRTIGRADAFRLGLATHCMSSSEFPAIIGALADACPVDELLDSRHQNPGPGDLVRHEETIAHCFAGETVAEILARLGAVTGVEKNWAEETAAHLNTRSPLSLAVTLTHLRACAKLNLQETLQMDYRLACRFLGSHDFYEGVRAVLIDKTGTPEWQPARIEDVTSAVLDAYFAPLGAEELVLPSRAEMQAAQVQG